MMKTDGRYVRLGEFFQKSRRKSLGLFCAMTTLVDAFARTTFAGAVYGDPPQFDRAPARSGKSREMGGVLRHLLAADLRGRAQSRALGCGSPRCRAGNDDQRGAKH